MIFHLTVTPLLKIVTSINIIPITPVFMLPYTIKRFGQLPPITILTYGKKRFNSVVTYLPISGMPG